jgi:hypothetical protein
MHQLLSNALFFFWVCGPLFLSHWAKCRGSASAYSTVTIGVHPSFEQISELLSGLRLTGPRLTGLLLRAAHTALVFPCDGIQLPTVSLAGQKTGQLLIGLKP